MSAADTAALPAANLAPHEPPSATFVTLSGPPDRVEYYVTGDLLAGVQPFALLHYGPAVVHVSLAARASRLAELAHAEGAGVMLAGGAAVEALDEVGRRLAEHAPSAQEVARG